MFEGPFGFQTSVLFFIYLFFIANKDCYINIYKNSTVQDPIAEAITKGLERKRLRRKLNKGTRKIDKDN